VGEPVTLHASRSRDPDGQNISIDGSTTPNGRHGKGGSPRLTSYRRIAMAVHN
jgi:hypothetical protein